MKQIAKTDQILTRLRAAYGPDADISGLAVYECVALTTLPLRKAGGIFQGARVSLSLLSELAASVNAESVPLQLVHDNEVVPFGRFFYAEVRDDELRGLFAVDAKNHPDIVAKIDNGTLDQVSVGFAPKRLTCSACGFDFLDPENLLNLWTLTCDDDHVVGKDGVFVHVDGLKQFFELSLVGKAASQGARIVGPSDAQLQHNEQFKLAASAGGTPVVRLSPTLKEPETTMNAEQMARFEAAISERAEAKAQLAAVTAERDSLQTQLTAAQEQVTQLTARVTELEAAAGQSEQNAKDAAAALAALQDEAKTVLTACGKADTEIPGDVAAVLSLIKEHRAQFAAVVPVGGASAEAATASTPAAPARPTAAFRAPK